MQRVYFAMAIAAVGCLWLGRSSARADEGSEGKSAGPRGYLAALDIAAKSITLRSGKAKLNHVLADKVTVTLDDKPIKLADLKVGTPVALKLDKDNKTVLGIEAGEKVQLRGKPEGKESPAPKRPEGKETPAPKKPEAGQKPAAREEGEQGGLRAGLLDSVDTKARTITIRLGKARTVLPVAEQVAVKLDDNPVTLADLKPGTPVSLKLSADKKQVVGIEAGEKVQIRGKPEGKESPAPKRPEGKEAPAPKQPEGKETPTDFFAVPEH